MQHRSGGTWRRLTTAALLLALPLPLMAQEPDVVVEEVETAPLPEISAEFEQELRQMLQDLSPEMRESILQDSPELRRYLVDQPEAPPAEPEEVAPANVEDHLSREEKRLQAEALIAELGEADEQRVAAIELELAALGEVALVPLKLAALGDDFELRSRAGGMARRLRWRLV